MTELAERGVSPGENSPAWRNHHHVRGRCSPVKHPPRLWVNGDEQLHLRKQVSFACILNESSFWTMMQFVTSRLSGEVDATLC